MSTPTTMYCVRCGKTKHWRDGFPSRTYAICWQCTWDQHMDENHPLSRSKRRQIRRTARRYASSRMVAEAKSEHALISLPEPIAGERYSGRTGRPTPVAASDSGLSGSGS